MKWLKKKTLGIKINLVAAGFAVLTMIAYAVAGKDSYGLVPMVEVLLGLGILCAVLSCVRDVFGFGPIVTMALYGAAFAVFINSRFMYYAHQYYGIASNPITTSMIVTTVGFVGIFLFGSIAGFMTWGERDAK